MSNRIGSFAWGVVLALLACEPKGSSNAPNGAGGGGRDGGQACGSGDASRDPVLVFRGSRRDGTADLTTARAGLRDSCEAGCGPSCLEYAHTSADAREAADYRKRACEAGDGDGCTLSGQLDLATAQQLCAAGHVLGCAAAVGLASAEAEAEAEPDWQGVITTAGDACRRDDGRGCSIAAWVRCAVQDQCDAQTVELADKGSRMLPLPDQVETFAIAQCRAGQAEAANATLAGSCEAGNTDACARSCEALRGQALLIREAERARTQQIALYLALNRDTSGSWYAVVSAMDGDQLADFEDMLAKFLPPVTEPGAKAKVPAAVREQAPELIEAILRSPQLDAKKIAYWIKRLPDMNDEQRINLLESLRKQWWIIPADGSLTPATFVEQVRLRGGGLSPGL